MTGELRFERPPARAWLVVAAVLAAGAAVAAAVAVLTGAPGWWVLCVGLVAFALPLWLGEGLLPRSVRADGEGVVVRSRWRHRRVVWGQLRRVRGAAPDTFPVRGDVALEREDGVLVGLPSEVPAGTVEGWRAQVGGGRPADVLPQVWRTPNPTRWMTPLYLTPLAAQLPSQLLNPDPEWVLVVISASSLGLGVVLLVYAWLRPPAGVLAGREGLVVRGVLRQRSIRWADVVEVRPPGRFDTKSVLVCADGTTRSLPVPVGVLEGWRTLAAQASA